MSGSTYGTLFRVTTWGESHGPALGVVIDGCPANQTLDIEKLQTYLDRRKPGKGSYASSRKESDVLHLLSGVFQGKTLGTPISIVFYNEDADSKDYSNLEHIFRPGHADASYQLKYGIRDYRGGGRSSGRETLARVAAGGVAIQLLEKMGITVNAYVHSIGGIQLPERNQQSGTLSDDVLSLLDRAKESGDSLGGIIECRISGMPSGIGEPVFDKLDARLSSAIFSIGSVKGVEIGSGIHAATMKGSEHNDPITALDSEGIHCSTNYAGGILGGISIGDDIVLRAAIKPTPSISVSQNTVDDTGNPISLSIQGRHDTCIAPRAAVVVESMCAITILDMIMEHNSRKLF